MIVAGEPSTGGASGADNATDPVVCMPLTPLAVPTRRIIRIGLALWAAALVITLAVPALRTGERSWWPWACVAGLGLGMLGYGYVVRGRGNAVGAEEPSL